MAEKFKRFLNLIGFGEEEDEGYYSEPEQEDISPVPRRTSEPLQTTRRSTPYRRNSEEGLRTSSARRTNVERPARRSITASHPALQVQRQNEDEMVHMIVVQPRSFEDTQTVIDHLVKGKAVVLNLEVLKPEAAQRVLDFVSGAIYALRGDTRKVSKGVFILTPSSVDISGSIGASYISALNGRDNGTGRK